LPQVVAVVRPTTPRSLRRWGRPVRASCAAHADEGMGASLACGVAQPATRAMARRLAMPWSSASTIARVAAAVADGAPVAAPFHDGRAGIRSVFGSVSDALPR
jgi:molybdenum cofactor cytidylyltransferase